MIKLSNIKIPAAALNAAEFNAVKSAAAALLGVAESSIESLTILKRSIDARHKNDVRFIYTVSLEAADEPAILSRCSAAAAYTPPSTYSFPYIGMSAEQKPVVVGMGPAGLFAAMCLSKAGIPCILLERGKAVEERTQDVERFWDTGSLDDRSNVQFGEGGAGTFSDGKLTTGISDPRIQYVLKSLTDFGAPEDILYLNKPHIGTDRLRAVVVNMRRELLTLGCDIRFEHQLVGLQADCGRLKGVDVVSGAGIYSIDTNALILAPGNSARDTFEMLERSGVTLSAKNFSVGVRIEHLQKSINLAQYGQAATLGSLPASDYKLAVHLKNGRTVYTFCVCPGGRVIASSSEPGHIVTNGMSEYARDGKNCNGGLLVSVTPEDFPTSEPLSGIAFQRELERAAFVCGGNNYKAPAQLVGDFLKKRPSKKSASVFPTYLPGVRWCNLWDVLPAFVCEALCEALPQLENSIHGFSNSDAVLTAVETRSSSPVRIDRVDYQAIGLKGLFPCGEGSGYAGGIMSAAVDGIRAAEALCASML